MGSWNGTCGISQLPILSGEKIRVFILKPHLYSEEGPNMVCYSTDVYSPVGVPLLAEYNDYGSAENITENYNATIIHEELAKSVVLPKDKPFNKGDEVETDDDNYLEVVDVEGDMITVQERLAAEPESKSVPMSEVRHSNRENYYDDIGDLEHTIGLIERNVFEIGGCNYLNPKELAVPGLFFVREKIWQALIADIEEESEYEYGYKSRQTMSKQIDDFIAELKQTIDELAEGTDEEKTVGSFRLGFGFETMGGEGNRVGSAFKSYSDGFNAAIYKKPLIDAVRDGDIDLAKTMLSDILDTTRFMTAMSYLRKALRPQCGSGSQSTGEEYHEVLVDAISSELNTIKSYWDE